VRQPPCVHPEFSDNLLRRDPLYFPGKGEILTVPNATIMAIDNLEL